MTEVTLVHGEYGNLAEETYSVNVDEIGFSDVGLKLHSLINYFKTNGVKIDNSMVLYWSTEKQIFVYAGNDPISEDFVVPFTEIDQERIVLKCR
jgi:hypothetical protein